MFFCVTALASFHKPRFIFENVHPRTHKLSLCKFSSASWKSCFEPPGVREPPVGNRWFRNSCLYFRKWKFF